MDDKMKLVYDEITRWLNEAKTWETTYDRGRVDAFDRVLELIEEVEK